MRTTPSQHRLQLMEVDNVFSKLLYTITRSRFRMNHSYRFSYMDHSHRMDVSTTHRLS